MYRRVLGATLVLGMMAVAPTPASLCAMLANLPGDCTQSPPKSECEQMGMAQPAVELKAASNLLCCQVSTPPLPEAPGKVVAPDASTDSLAAKHIALPAQLSRFFQEQALHPAFPPDRQQLLCVFLI